MKTPLVDLLQCITQLHNSFQVTGIRSELCDDDGMDPCNHTDVSDISLEWYVYHWILGGNGIFTSEYRVSVVNNRVEFVVLFVCS